MVIGYPLIPRSFLVSRSFCCYQLSFESLQPICIFNAPLLVLLRLHVSPLQQGVPRSIRYSARILGAQTGDTLYESDDVGRTLNYHALKFDPENRYVVGFERRNVTIDFTEDVSDDE